MELSVIQAKNQKQAFLFSYERSSEQIEGTLIKVSSVAHTVVNAELLKIANEFKAIVYVQNKTQTND